MARFAYLLAFLPLVGCAPMPYDGGVVCVQPGSPDWLLEATSLASESWRKASQGQISLSVVEGSGDECDATIYAGIIDGAPDGLCYALIGEKEITIDPFKDKDVPVYSLVAHELGHAMGADHTDNPKEIMHSPVKVWEPTVGDVLQIID
jgi:hypothetical protein